MALRRQPPQLPLPTSRFPDRKAKPGREGEGPRGHIHDDMEGIDVAGDDRVMAGEIEHDDRLPEPDAADREETASVSRHDHTVLTEVPEGLAAHAAGFSHGAGDRGGGFRRARRRPCPAR
ncbi:hypothetical protein [Ochrobactrum sp. BTU2]|uniref:hypothetical protein n=1 Tax=Ochrobactrum sp. BTU2 TaxID=2856166 RepID=UPI002119CF39|nr:hypothetical protein [Ochrobactrum sp. BTU2]MCQ9148054.1 hypothetical protein [Ochrobactrum sp. BTU2]